MRLLGSVGNPGSLDLAAGGGFTLRLSCGGSPGGFRTSSLVVVGSGEAQMAGVKSIDDALAPNFSVPFTKGVGVDPGGATIAMLGFQQPFPGDTRNHFYRLGGTLVLHTASAVRTVVFDMVLSGNDSSACWFRGTAVPST